MWSEKDTDYWIAKEEEIAKAVVDLSGHGFVIDSLGYKRGLTDDPLLYARLDAIQALVKAKESLPDGLNIKVVCAWRSWDEQEIAAAQIRAEIVEAHPDWTEKEVDEQQWIIAPPIRLVPSLSSHRYAGAFDITLVDADRKELDMGVPIGYSIGPEAQLLWYQFIEEPNDKERTARMNRMILIKAMTKAGFTPYLEEFWHWEYLRDFSQKANDVVKL